MIKAGDDKGKVNLKLLMDELYKLKIDSVLIEGGGTLNYSAIEEGIVDKVMIFIAPRIIGGKDAITPFEGTGTDCLDQAITLKNLEICKFKQDILITGYLQE